MYMKIGDIVPVSQVERCIDGSCLRKDKVKGHVVQAFTDNLVIDTSWLALAADIYKISPNIGDYLINEIPLVTADVPNRNLEEFPYEEIVSWSPHQGRVVYQTFIGKPTYKDHQNSDPLKAKGVIFDSQLIEYRTKNDSPIYKIKILAGWDHTKDKKLVGDIEAGKRFGYSMGSWVKKIACSICGTTSSQGPVNCSHMMLGKGKGRIFKGALCYERCREAYFFECSSVSEEKAADFDAVADWRASGK